MSAALAALAARAVKAGDDRLDGRLTRQAHAVIIAGIGAELEAMGLGWDDLMAAAGS